MKTLLMARFTFREALRKRVLHGVLALTVAFLLLYGLGAWLAFRELAAQQAPRPELRQDARPSVHAAGPERREHDRRAAGRLPVGGHYLQRGGCRDPPLHRAQAATAARRAAGQVARLRRDAFSLRLPAVPGRQWIVVLFGGVWSSNLVLGGAAAGAPVARAAVSGDPGDDIPPHRSQRRDGVRAVRDGVDERLRGAARLASSETTP